MSKPLSILALMLALAAAGIWLVTGGNGCWTKTSVPVKLTYLKDKLAARTNGQMQGDLLVIGANFAIKRSDFRINPNASEDKVADTIELTLSIAGATPR